MGTEGITPEPEALVSPQLAAEVHEIEAKSESAEATPSTPTTGIPGGTVVVEALDSHQFALHVTLNRIVELAPRFFASKEEYAKVRLELGRELHTLQELHAKPGCGDFVERLKALRSKTKISRSTAYALIAEYEIFAGLRRKDPPRHPHRSRQSVYPKLGKKKAGYRRGVHDYHTTPKMYHPGPGGTLLIRIGQQKSARLRCHVRRTTSADHLDALERRRLSLRVAATAVTRTRHLLSPVRRRADPRGGFAH